MEQKKTTMNLKSEVIHKFIFKSPREVLEGILSGGVPPGSSNTDPIWDQKINFLHLISNKNSY